jgi:hypothetical protein
VCNNNNNKNNNNNNNNNSNYNNNNNKDICVRQAAKYTCTKVSGLVMVSCSVGVRQREDLVTNLESHTTSCIQNVTAYRYESILTVLHS